MRTIASAIQSTDLNLNRVANRPSLRRMWLRAHLSLRNGCRRILATRERQLLTLAIISALGGYIALLADAYILTSIFAILMLACMAPELTNISLTEDK